MYKIKKIYVIISLVISRESQDGRNRFKGIVGLF